MPHLIIEYAQDLSSNEQARAMLDAVHDAALSSELFVESHIKTRLIPVTHYRVGSSQDRFIHAQLRIKSGRDMEQKKALSEAVLMAIRSQNWPANVITVEVVEMDDASYAKYTAP